MPFRFVEGATSDLSFEATGATLGEVFRDAAEALLAATVERPEAVEARRAHALRMSDTDRELLLLRFLNELIYLRDAEGLLLRPLRVECRGEAPLDAARHGQAGDVKAATAHGLLVERTGAGWRATVTLDV